MKIIKRRSSFYSIHSNIYSKGKQRNGLKYLKNKNVKIKIEKSIKRTYEIIKNS